MEEVAVEPPRPEAAEPVLHFRTLAAWPAPVTVAPVGWLALTAAILLTFTPAWRVVRYFDTYLHELGHAFVALLFGGKVRAIRLHQGGGGLTTWSAHASAGLLQALRFRFVQLLVLSSGYTAGAVLGASLALAWSCGPFASEIALWVLAALTLLSVPDCRGWRALLTASLTAAAAAAAAYGPEGLHVLLPTVAAVSVSASLRTALHLHRTPLMSSDGSDPGEMSRLTRLPPRFYTALFLGVDLLLASLTVAVLLGWMPTP